MRYGTASPAALAERAKAAGMRALGLTDRDGLYGAVKHAQACARAGISPIIGTDLALRDAPESQAAPRRRPGLRRRPPNPAVPPPVTPPRLVNETAARVTLLACAGGGWASLCHLVSAAHRAGERSVPAVTPDLVAEHADGLVALLGPGSDVGRAVAAGHTGAAQAALDRWRDRAEVVIEVVDHLGPGGTRQAGRMLRLAREAGLPAVLTNAARYLDPADQPVAQVLDAARQLTPLGRRHLAGHNAQAYLKDSEQMARIAARICGSGPDPRPARRPGSSPGNCPSGSSGDGPGSSPGDGALPSPVPHCGPGRCDDPAHELLAATAELAERCSLDPRDDLGLGLLHLPEVPGGDELSQLRRRCHEGMHRRGLSGPGALPGHHHEAAQRLARELDIIARTGLASYFLTVADVAALIRSRGIRCAIRGSGAGCLVNYLIGISDINPLEHGLIMERFLSESRLRDGAGLPDIDLDVESARRIEAYRAIIERYGEERCGCVSMMETYRARSAIRDTAAAFGLPPHEIDVMAKAFGHIRARGIRAALADLPELRASNLAVSQLTSLFKIAEKLDGLPRHIAMHPCGVVLSSGTLPDRVPVERSAEGLPLCQYDMDDVEAAGMIKLDVLGVRMQSAMTYTLAEIERTRGDRVDIDSVGDGDGPTFEMIRTGRTLGCFQIESPGQRELVTRLEPRGIGDLIVDISLFRPGPVNSDMITPYLSIKHGRRPACYPHENLAGALRETGGVVIFHEQVLRILHVMTDCSFSHAERLRRDLSDNSARPRVQAWFQGAAAGRGYDSVTVQRVWEVLEAFGGFGFCKAHAAAFAIPTYQSAWLKRHYPAAFYAGVLVHEPGMYPKRVIAGDARLSGVPVLPMDVNISAGDWRVERVARRWGDQPGRRERRRKSRWPRRAERRRRRRVREEGEARRAGEGPPEGLRTGLREVKGISDAEVTRIVTGQPYASLRDFWERARASRPVTERLVLVGAFDAVYPGPGQPTRRDLLSRVGVLAGPAARAGATARAGAARLRPAGPMLPFAGPGGGPGAGEGLAGLVRAGELPEMSLTERVAAELDILGIDISQHVAGFYTEILRALGVVHAADLHRCRSGASVLVAGVKTSTQTPAVRSGQRIIFATLDDGTGQMNLAFFESVQPRCAARVFGSWLLVVRGRVRRPPDPRREGSADGGPAASVNAAECWDLAALEEIREARGIGAVRAAMAAGDVPGPGAAAGPGRAARGPGETAASPDGGPDASPAGEIVYPTGFRLSPYAETGSPGGPLKGPPRKLWHASPGSSGGWAGPEPGSRSPAGRDTG
jgi:error-prone DNA polymerase